MEITWLGGACFRIRGRDAAVATDPSTAKISKRSARPKADLVTLSDATADADADAVRANHGDRVPFIADGPGEYEVCGVYVHGVSERPGGATTLYTIDVDHVTVGHFASLSAELSDALVDELGPIHVLLIDVDADRAGTAGHAVQLINRIEPNIVVPYGRDNGANGDPDVAWLRIARDLSGAGVVGENSVSVNRSNLPEPVTVRVLEARHA